MIGQVYIGKELADWWALSVQKELKSCRSRSEVGTSVFCLQDLPDSKAIGTNGWGRCTDVLGGFKPLGPRFQGGKSFPAKVGPARPEVCFFRTTFWTNPHLSLPSSLNLKHHISTFNLCLWQLKIQHKSLEEKGHDEGARVFKWIMKNKRYYDIFERGSRL